MTKELSEFGRAGRVEHKPVVAYVCGNTQEGGRPKRLISISQKV